MENNPDLVGLTTDGMEEWLKNQQAMLLEKADALCGRFYEEREHYQQRAKANRDYKLLGDLGCRARIQSRGGRGIVIEWFRQKYVGEKGNRQAFSTTIKKGRHNNEYARSKVVLDTTTEWEARMFDELEPQFAELRAASRALGKVSRQLLEYRKKLAPLGMA